MIGAVAGLLPRVRIAPVVSGRGDGGVGDDSVVGVADSEARAGF
jgi:hypothetical protein